MYGETVDDDFEGGVVVGWEVGWSGSRAERRKLSPPRLYFDHQQDKRSKYRLNLKCDFCIMTLYIQIVIIDPLV